MSRPAWLRRENRARLNMTMACEQIYEEAHYMYFAENAFLFKLNDSRVYYRYVEPVANWLYTLSQVSVPPIDHHNATINHTTGRACRSQQGRRLHQQNKAHA